MGEETAGPIIVRRWEKADLEAVLAVEEAAFGHPWNRSAFEEELDNPVANYLVLEQAGRIIAYGGFWLVLGIVQGVFDIVPEGENGGEESSRLIARRALGHAHGTEEESASVEAMGMEHFEDCLRRHIAERNRNRVEDEEVGR